MIIDKMPDVQALSLEDKARLAEEIWDEIAQSRDPYPVPDAHLRIVEERMAHYAANPDAVKPWEDVKADLMRRIRETKN